MTDKKKTLLWIIEDIQALQNQKQLIDRVIHDGNAQMLVLRQASLDEPEGVFNAVTSLSLIDEGSLCQQLKDSVSEMTDFEIHHFQPNSFTDYSQMWHRPMPTCLFTSSDKLRQKTESMYHINQLQSPEEMLTTGEPYKLYIIHQSSETSAESGELINQTVSQAFNSSQFIVQIVIGPMSINPTLLRPQDSQLPFAPPKQSYLTYGPIEL